MKILFDTDPGIDDAMALLTLARDLRAELVGITTVFGNASVDQTTTNALALCERFAIDVPVARGAARPLIGNPLPFPTMVHGTHGLGCATLARPMHRFEEKRNAAQFICDCARLHSRQLVLVGVAPLTNLALALHLDPDIVHHVLGVVVMGGSFAHRGHRGNVSPVAEANVANDPHAADQVFTAEWPVTIVGLDVTHEVLLTVEELDHLGAHGGDEGAFIRDITRHYENFYRSRTGGGLYAHDVTAALCALNSDHFQMSSGPVRVVTEGLAIGQTILSPEGSSLMSAPWEQIPSQSVCVAVDAQRIKADFLRTFGALVE